MLREMRAREETRIREKRLVLGTLARAFGLLNMAAAAPAILETHTLEAREIISGLRRRCRGSRANPRNEPRDKAFVLDKEIAGNYYGLLLLPRL
jgi:hypothetical protein